MQHWEVFTKLNEKQFDEAFEAFEANRSDKNPKTTWYENELDFFDSIVLPLTKKLANCGVFGDAGDDFFQFAASNRDEWERKGFEMVKGYVEHYHEHCFHANPQPAYVTNATASFGTTDEPSRGPSREPSRHSNEASKHSVQLSADFQGEAKSIGTAPSLAGASASSIHTDETDDPSTSDPDIVYAVLVDPTNPMDFHSYTLITPKMKRTREEELQKRNVRNSVFSRTSMLTRASGDERLKRRIRRQFSTASGDSEYASRSSVYSRSGSMGSRSVGSSTSGSSYT